VNPSPVTTERHDADLRSVAKHHPLIGSIIERWASVGLPDCWIVAGALAQSVWNHALGLPSTHGITDVDLVYFDAEDLSEDGEVRQSMRIRDVFSDLRIWIDVKNEARVHLWYESKFGKAIQPYVSTADAITTFPTTATAVGLQPTAGKLKVYAPYGLTDLFGLVVRPNKKQITRLVYEAKVAKWIKLWPSLHIVPWAVESSS
jgi:hypothetical protein